MYARKLLLLFGLALGSGAVPLVAQADTLLVASPSLGYDVAVVVLDLTPDGGRAPLVYLTDGFKWLDAGLADTLRRLTATGAVRPARYVFVSSRPPGGGADRREAEFLANPAYLQFFTETLLPAVEESVPHPVAAADRALVGLSFGGLNAAWFASRGAPFAHYGLLSPITYPYPKLTQDIAFGPAEGQRFFVSTGRYDAERYVDPLLALYRAAGTEVRELRTAGGHDFVNWLGQVEALLDFLF